MNEHYTKFVCPVCGKVFYPAVSELWGWKIGETCRPKLVCSYKCQREWENKPRKKSRINRKRVAVKIVETGEIFECIEDCANKFDVSASWLSKCLRTGRAYNGIHIERVG